jgi:hypothetical protein
LAQWLKVNFFWFYIDLKLVEKTNVKHNKLFKLVPFSYTICKLIIIAETWAVGAGAASS